MIALYPKQNPTTAWDTPIDPVLLAAGAAAALPPRVSQPIIENAANPSAAATFPSEEQQFTWSSVQVRESSGGQQRELVFGGYSAPKFVNPDLDVLPACEENRAGEEVANEGNGPNGEVGYQYRYPPPPPQRYNYSTEVIPESELTTIKPWWEE